MLETKNRAMGGFFFAVMALAMLSLVLMTVQVWVQTFEQSDYRASQRFKGEAMRAILTSLSDKSLSDFANASAFYATYKMANYTSDLGNGGFAHLASDDPNNLKTGLVERTAIELMVNGSSEPNAGKLINYSEEERNAYTLVAWQNMTDSAANAMGFDIVFSDAKNIKYYQIDPWTVRVSFDLEMNITDSEGTMRQQKKMKAESSFSVSGFLDPMITRNDMKNRGMEREAATEKQVFRLQEYSVPEDVKPTMADSAGIEGNGWFFGPIIEDYPNLETGFVNLKQYALVHTYDENLSVYADSYGAVIVTTQPEVVQVDECLERQIKCLNCMERYTGAGGCPANTGWQLFPNNNAASVPVIVASSEWDINDVMKVTKAQEGGQLVEQYVLIDNSYESPEDKMRPDAYHRIWDITKLRDMAICGFYVHGGGPSFFQRMLANAEGIPNTELGIESFVVGKWAGGADDQARDFGSRLDWEFYGGNIPWNVAKIKGMMGCKGKEMCSGDDALELGVGHFRLSKDAVEDYLARDISCLASGPISPCD